MLSMLTRVQVREALNAQNKLKENGNAKPIGQLFVERGWLNPRQVAAILVAQRRYRQGRQGQGATSGAPASGNPAHRSPPAAAASTARADSAPVSSNKKNAAREKKNKHQVLGPFELRRRLGEGSMGAVFETFDREKKRIVALKILPRNLAGNPEFLERFKREVKTVQLLHHPHIVAYHGAGQAGGYWYLAMEYVDGGSLSQRLGREKRLPEREALRIAREVALALAHAQQRSMIHRDIKPENILLTRGGSVKVTDFGLAKSQEDTSKLTAVGLSIGTPHYLSPEQALGKEQIDHRADLYGLGVTLFHLLTGHVPFDHESSTQVMVMHVQKAPPDPRSLAPSVSRSAAQVVLKLLEKEPRRRYQSAEELVRVFDRMLSGKPPEAEDAGRVGGATGKRLPRTKLLDRVRRGPKGCLSQLAAALLAAAGGAGLLLLLL